MIGFNSQTVQAHLEDLVLDDIVFRRKVVLLLLLLGLLGGLRQSVFRRRQLLPHGLHAKGMAAVSAMQPCQTCRQFLLEAMAQRQLACIACWAYQLPQ